MGSSTTGFDCSQRQEYIMQGACLTQNLCHNGGTCYDTMIVGAQKSTGCYCPYETYGEYCEYNSVKTECYADRMIININPGPNFAGIIFVHQPPVMAPMPGFGPAPAAGAGAGAGAGAAPAAGAPPPPAVPAAGGLSPVSPGAQCLIPTVSSQVMFSLDPVRSNWQGYATQLFYNGTMCGVQPNRTVTATEVTFTYEVMVQYDPNKSDPLVDEIISFSCPRPNKAAGPIGPTAVLFSVADGTGAMVRNPKLGSPVTISFSVDPSSIFTDILVQSCTVSSTRNGMSKMVVKDSCPVKPFGKSLEKLGHTHVLTLVMHALGHDPNLDFDCAVKVCTVSDPSCQQQPFCPVVHGPPTTGAHHGGSPMGADPHAHGGAGASTDILGMMGMGGSGGASALDSLLAGGGTGAGGATGGAGAGTGARGSTVLGGGDTMMLQDLMNSLGGGGGAGTGPSGTGGAGSGAPAGAAGADFLSSLMNMAGGSGAIGTNVMNDMLFGAPTGSSMGGGGPAGGMMGGSPTGMMGGGMMMGYRRRRSVKEYEEEEEEEAASRLSSSTVVRVSGRLPL